MNRAEMKERTRRKPTEDNRLTDVGVAWTIGRDAVVEVVVVVEVERLECVEDEVAHVLVHVGLQHATVKVVDRATSVHHLAQAETAHT